MPDEKDYDINIPLKNYTECVDKLYESLKNITEGQKLTTMNVILVSTHLMQIVEKYPNINGSQKKETVIHVLKKLVIDTLDGDDEKALLLFIETFLPSVIDIIIAVDKKELAVKVKKGFKSCFSCC